MIHSACSTDDLVDKKEIGTQAEIRDKREEEKLLKFKLETSQTIETQKEKLKKNDKQVQSLMKVCIEQEIILGQAQHYLENIHYQSSMLLTLINDLLDLAKLETMNF